MRKPAARSLLGIVLGLLAASAVMAYIWVGPQASSGGPPSKTAPATKAAPERLPKTDAYVVGPADLTRTLLTTGELRASQSRELKVPQIRSGFASTITFLVLEGTQVKQGQRILEFDASGLLSQKSEVERRLNEAKLKIDKTKADQEAQRADLLIEQAQTDGNLKVAQLYAKIEKSLLPANTYQKYQLDLQKAILARDKTKERLANLEANIPANLALVQVELAQAELDLKKIDGDLALLEVDAPQDGIVVYGDNWASNRKVQVGDNLFPGMTVLTLPDLTSMQVVGFVYDTELRFLSPGMICQIHLDSVPNRTWRGRIESLTSVANRKGFASQHKVFRSVVQPDSVDLGVMKPGMTARIEVNVSLGGNVLAVPRDYLGTDTAGRYYVMKGTDRRSASVQVVKVGRFSDNMVEILSGVSAGDRIIPIHQAPAEVTS